MEEFRVKIKRNCCFLPRFVFRCLGISVNKHESIPYKIYSIIMIFTGSMFPWTSLHLIMHNLDNYDVIISGLFNLVGGFAAFLKIIVIIYHRIRLRKVFEKIEALQKERNTETWSQMEIYNTNKIMSAALVVFYGSLMTFYAGTLIVRVVVDDPKKWKTPISEFSLFNTTYSPNFEIAWLYHSIAPTMTASGFCMSDYLIAALIVDTTVQFKILRKFMVTQFESVTMKKREIIKSSTTTYGHLDETVKQIVEHHLSLIDLVNEIEKVCSHLLLIGVIASLCIMSFSLYYASVLPLLNSAALLSYFEVTMVTIALFFICYFGTEMSVASESLASTCYELDFVGIDVRFQKSLQLIMLRSQKPVRLTVGGYTGLSITVFAWIMRSTYSYFMVLRKNTQSQQNAL